jgi:VWFA-related protein
VGCFYFRCLPYNRRVSRVLVSILGLLLLAPQDRPRFQSAASTVFVYATVQGADGRLVPNLTAADFTIRDEGQVQRITVFDDAPQALTLVAMFDMSNSMTKLHRQLQEAAAAFIGALWTGDRIRIGSFGREIALSPLLTSDKPTLRRILDEELWTGGPTPLWASTQLAMTSLSSEQGRRVVLLFTDGEDAYHAPPPFANDTSPAAIRARAERENFMIYAIGFPGSGLSGDLRVLATDSGGGFALVSRTDDLGAKFAAVVDELHHQYVLGFAADAHDGRSHSLTVTARPGMKVQARKSYRAN